MPNRLKFGGIGSWLGRLFGLADFKRDFVDAGRSHQIQDVNDVAVTRILVAADEDAQIRDWSFATRPALITSSLLPIGFLSRKTEPALSTEMSTKSRLASGVAVVAVGRFTFTLFMFTMLRLTSMKDGEQKEHDVDQGDDLDARFGTLIQRQFGASLTGMGVLLE